MLRTASLLGLILILVSCWAYAQEPEVGAGHGTAPPNQAPPRSDRDTSSEESSSKDGKVDLTPPKDDAKNHPNSDSSQDEGNNTQVQEFHPWDPHKAAKDIEVGDFYLKRKNFIAAEGRYRDALLWKPNDAIATYRLGETAEKQGKLDEAREHYESYLKILPNGPLAQDARKALERLNKLETKNASPK